MDLATATGTYNEINQLARIIRSEGELAVVIETVKSFRGILNSCHKRLDIQVSRPGKSTAS